MGLFEGMLKDGETLFKNEIALDFSFQPKMILYREKEQFKIASCIRPLFQKRTGTNLIITGIPGIGKTAAARHVIEELEEETDDIIPIYINCWQKSTTYKIVLELCEKIGYRFTHNKKTEELFKIVRDSLNKKSAVFVFDEVDKLEDFNFLYSILEEVYRKAIVMITNYKEWTLGMDQRVKSRLVPELIEFKQYSRDEIEGILRQRMDSAFNKGVFDEEPFKMIADKCYDAGDVRVGLHLMRASAQNAESESKRKVAREHVEKAMGQVGDMTPKDKEDLDNDAQFILEIIKKNSGKKIGDLHKIYLENGGNAIYKTFQRRIKKLADNKFVSAKKISGGAEGKTTIVSFVGKMKKLDEFS